MCLLSVCLGYIIASDCRLVFVYEYVVCLCVCTHA